MSAQASLPQPAFLPQRSCPSNLDRSQLLPVLAVLLAILSAGWSSVCSAQDAPKSADAAFVIHPASVKLHGPDALQQVIVSAQADGYDVDLTRDATFESADESIVSVTSGGLIRPVGDGSTVVRVRHGDRQAIVEVAVSAAGQPQPVDFQNDIIPVLTAGGCNSGPCHGKARGQGGFKLSLFGFDAEYDFGALSRESRGRRVFQPSPEQSLLLLKPVGKVPHGGGLRLSESDPSYAVLKRWIESGMQRSVPDSPTLERVSIDPAERLLKFDAGQQLIVTAHYSDGSTRDVTRMSAFQSNEAAVAGVDHHGLVTTTNVAGEAAVMARYMGLIAVATISVPLPEKVPADVYQQLPRHNFIDDLVWKKLQRLNLTPSPPAADHEYLRRVYVDIIGRLPTVEETRAFLHDEAADKRTRLVDALLEHPEYADHQANRWADLLRPNPYRVGIKAVLNYDNWIRDAFRRNQPYDEFVHDLLTARGSTFRNGATVLFRDRRTPDELTTIVSQLFLGIRLECAKCHQHPNEVWGQHQFYSFAAYFDRIRTKGVGVSPPISGSEEFFYSGARRAVTHPLSGEEMTPKPLFGEASIPEGQLDPRETLAAWITSDDNAYFRQVITNRIWRDMMGRGLVEPVDDLRATNPPSNAELLETLAVDLRDHDYDLKHLMRTIASSYVYGLSSAATPQNIGDTRNYSRFYRERLRAEVLLDSVCRITGVPEKFAAMPPDSDARQLWSHRIDSLFLDAFGRPDPNQDPPCERTPDTTIVQALHLMNSQSIYSKVTADGGTAATLATGDLDDAALVEQLYLSVYSRYPAEDEKQAVLQFLAEAADGRRKAVESLLWAMINTPEFIFKH